MPINNDLNLFFVTAQQSYEKSKGKIFSIFFAMSYKYICSAVSISFHSTKARNKACVKKYIFSKILKFKIIVYLK
jgi:hypothetical protein